MSIAEKISENISILKSQLEMESGILHKCNWVVVNDEVEPFKVIASDLEEAETVRPSFNILRPTIFPLNIAQELSEHFGFVPQLYADFLKIQITKLEEILFTL